MADKIIKHTIPILKADEVKNKQQIFLILDAREKNEFLISHLKYAKHIGFDFPDFSALKNIPKTTPILVYCSVGYRSEKMAEKIKALGYKNVFNLFGGIFYWSNNHLPLVDSKNKPSNKIHGYSKDWGKWLNSTNVVYE
jgi:rhodanese-related sulfurtransferase